MDPTVFKITSPDSSVSFLLTVTPPEQEQHRIIFNCYAERIYYFLPYINCLLYITHVSFHIISSKTYYIPVLRKCKHLIFRVLWK